MTTIQTDLAMVLAGLLTGWGISQLHTYLARRQAAQVLAATALHLAARHVEALMGWALRNPDEAAEWLAARRVRRLERVTWIPKPPRDEADPPIPADVEREINELVEAAWGKP